MYVVSRCMSEHICVCMCAYVRVWVCAYVFACVRVCVHQELLMRVHIEGIVPHYRTLCMCMFVCV